MSVRPAPVAVASGSAGAGTSRAWLHVGSYAPAGAGIYHFACDPLGGQLQPVGHMPNAHSPSWLHAEPAHRRVYAAEEGGDHVSVLEQTDGGGLRQLQRLPSGGRGPCHLALVQGRLWVAHYGDAQLAALNEVAQGRLAPAQSWRAHAEAGGHAHMLQPSPDGRWLLGTDLGLDRLHLWPLQGAPWPPGQPQVLAFAPGSGPRHFAFHPSRPELVYVLHECSNRLATVQLEPQGARLLHECSVLPAGYAGTSFASDLLVAPGARHLYALNRLHNSLAVISLTAPEQPRLLDHHWTHGDYPRSACLVGSHLYVCNQRSDQLSHFDLKRPDRPRYSGRQWAVPSPAGACALPA